MVPYPSLSSQVAIVFPVGVIASVNLIIAGLVVTCALRAVISLKIKKKKEKQAGIQENWRHLMLTLLHVTALSRI